MVGKSARFLAPMALAAVTVGIYLIVHSTIGTKTVKTAPTSAIIHTSRKAAPKKHTARFYVVKPGDTLSSIAARTGVSLTQITALNRSLAATPNNLQTGQRLRLRR